MESKAPLRPYLLHSLDWRKTGRLYAESLWKIRDDGSLVRRVVMRPVVAIRLLRAGTLRLVSGALKLFSRDARCVFVQMSSRLQRLEFEAMRERKAALCSFRLPRSILRLAGLACGTVLYRFITRLFSGDVMRDRQTRGINEVSGVRSTQRASNHLE